MDIFLQQLINGLVLGSIYALVALGYTMVYGIMQLINFAHGEVVMIGAMVASQFTSARNWPLAGRQQLAGAGNRVAWRARINARMHGARRGHRAHRLSTAA